MEQEYVLFFAMVATISPVCCRGQWYQPEEPDGISEIKREME